MSLADRWLKEKTASALVAKRVLRRDVLDHLQGLFRLEWQGIHGLPHWVRLMQYGMRIAEREGGDPWVVAWFAILHDHQRWDDGDDRHHGPRAADAMVDVQALGWFDDLNPTQIDLITEAVRHHSDGWIHSNPSIGACWDGDRLDLVRLGIAPSIGLLSTNTAKKMASIHTVNGQSALRHRLAVVRGGATDVVMR